MTRKGDYRRNGGFTQALSFVLCSAVMLLDGCASTPISLRKTLNTPVRIVVVQEPMAVDTARLKEVVAPGSKQALTATEEPLAHYINHAQEHAALAMSSALANTRRFAVVSMRQGLELPVPFHGYGGVISQDEADRLREATGADALLRFRITDYGLTPRAWRNGYIAFEVTTTLALAAVIAYSGSKAAKTAAGIYLVQEGVEETASAYAGFWALDVSAHPVRVEAELISLNPIRTLWQDSNTGLSDIKLSRLYRTIGEDERNGQLDQATDNAVKGIASDLSRAFAVNLADREQQSQ